MNYLASISLLLLFLIKGLVPNMDLCCELLKIPNLMEHYEEHKACNDGSFWQFLVDDYLNIDGDSMDHPDDSDHNNLPFHSSHQCCHASVFYSPAQYYSLEIFEFNTQIEFVVYGSFHTADFFNSPFQPPKV